jgi:hypothetical protein
MMTLRPSGPVSHPGVPLGLQRVQIGGQRRGEVLPCSPQGDLGALDDLPVQAEVQGRRIRNVASDATPLTCPAVA